MEGTSIEEIRAKQQAKLDELNKLVEDTTLKEWNIKSLDKMKIMDVATSVRSTMIELWMDLVEKKISWQEALLRRPDRWSRVGIFLLAVSLFLYLIDVLG